MRTEQVSKLKALSDCGSEIGWERNAGPEDVCEPVKADSGHTTLISEKLSQMIKRTPV